MTEMILDVLLMASAKSSTIEATCSDLEDVADSNTIREYLNQAVEVKSLRERETQINTALASCIPDAMERTAIESAINFHDEPLYGKGEQPRQADVRSQQRRGRPLPYNRNRICPARYKSGIRL